MSLLYVDGSADRVDCGSGSTLDNINEGAILCWIYPTSTANVSRSIFDKENTAGSRGTFLNKRGADGTSLRLYRIRATTDMDIISNTGAITANVWQCVFGSWSTTTSALCKIYVGASGGVLTDVTSSASIGSGTASDDSGDNAIWGNNANFNNAWPGRIGTAMLFNRAVALGEAKSLMYSPKMISGCVLYNELGYSGTGTQPDLSGNGNNGTVTSATQAIHNPTSRYEMTDVYSPYVVAAGASVFSLQHIYRHVAGIGA